MNALGIIHGMAGQENPEHDVWVFRETMQENKLEDALTLLDGFEQIFAQRLLLHPLLAGIAGLWAITLLLDADGIQATAGATNGFAAQYVAQSHSQKNQ